MENNKQQTPEKTYYTFVCFGSGPMPARGPFRSLEEADEAMARFQSRHGYVAGTYLASGSVRLVGPYPTRAKALVADIGTARTAQRP